MFNREKCENLTEAEKIALRRDFGKQLKDAKTKAIIAYYATAPKNKSKKEAENSFLAATMYCHYDAKGIVNKEGGEELHSFVEAASMYYSICTDSQKRALLFLCDATYSTDGTFFPRLHSLLRKMEAKGIFVAVEDLFQQLQFWDKKSTERKVEIAKRITKMEDGNNVDQCTSDQEL